MHTYRIFIAYSLLSLMIHGHTSEPDHLSSIRSHRSHQKCPFSWKSHSFEIEQPPINHESGSLQSVGETDRIDKFCKEDTIRFNPNAPVSSLPVSGFHCIEPERIHDNLQKQKTKPLLDISVPEIDVPAIWHGGGGIGLEGEGVCIGIYDSGIDWSHTDFIDDQGQSRILYLWDQTDSSGTPPVGYDYGTEYTQIDINTEIDGSPAGIVKSYDLWGHGTHVAGIAAGNGNASTGGYPSGQYIGVAPKANLIIVKGGDYQFITERIRDGIDYMIQKADLLEMPIAINLSVGGTHKGPHDGTSEYERNLNQFLMQEGRAIIVAAGNERDDNIHFMGDFSPGAVDDTLTVTIYIPDNQPSIEDYVALDVWYHPFTGLTVSVISPDDSIYGPVLPQEPVRYWKTSEGTIQVNNASSGVSDQNGDMELEIYISDTRENGIVQDHLKTGTWKLFFAGKPGRFDGWLYESSMGSYIQSPVDTTTLLAEPANARLCLSVVSYITRNQWPSLWSDPWGPGELEVGNLSTFSSPGPTRTNAKGSNPLGKPEIAAPGEYILSSYSSHTLNLPSDHFIAVDSVHRAWNGTSMAAPHVTGVVALMFQQNPLLSPSDIKNRIIQSARKDQYTGIAWNRDWGYGKLDAFQAVYPSTGIDDDRLTSYGDDDSLHLYIYPNPFNRSAVIEFTYPKQHLTKEAVYLELFDVRGCIVQSWLLNRSDQSHIVWEGMNQRGERVSTGVYIARLRGPGILKSKKVLYIR
jgi:subtilisin family serine protease